MPVCITGVYYSSTQGRGGKWHSLRHSRREENRRIGSGEESRWETPIVSYRSGYRQRDNPRE